MALTGKEYGDRAHCARQSYLDESTAGHSHSGRGGNQSPQQIPRLQALANQIQDQIINGTIGDSESFGYFRLMLQLRERRFDRLRFLTRLVIHSRTKRMGRGTIPRTTLSALQACATLPAGWQDSSVHKPGPPAKKYRQEIQCGWYFRLSFRPAVAANFANTEHTSQHIQAAGSIIPL